MKTVEEKAKEYCRPTIAYYKFNGRNNFDEIEILLKESFIAGYTEANKWISVEDELPNIGQKVLLKDDYGEFELAFYRNLENGRLWYRDLYPSMDYECQPINEDIMSLEEMEFIPTHWKPLS